MSEREVDAVDDKGDLIEDHLRVEELPSWVDDDDDET